MAHADPSGAKKRSTRKTKSTRDEDAFVYDFGLPPVHFPSATDQQLKTEESHKGDTPLNTVHALSPQQQQMLAVDHILAEPNHLAQKISLVQAERDKLALELELLRLKQAQSTPPPPSGAAKGQGTSASPPMTRKKRHVDWPHEFCPGMSTNVEYEKLDLAEFVAGYLAMIKTYDPEATKFMLRHLELLMIKGISYTWTSVRSFHAHIAKQVELYRLEWSDAAEIRDRANTFFKHSDLRPAPTSRATSSSTPTTRAKPDGNQENRGCRQWNYTGSCPCDKDKDTYPAQHKCRVCTQDHPMLHCAKRRNPIPSTF